MNNTLSKNMARDFVAYLTTKSQIALIGSILGFGFIGANSAQAVTLGRAADFAVLGGTTVTNTGLSIITGDLGVTPGTAVTGFLPGIVRDGTIRTGTDPIAAQAKLDVQAAYTALAGLTHTQNLTGADLGGRTLTSGVYFFSSSVGLTGNLILNALGDSNARFVFQIGSTLTTASNSSVSLLNGADARNVFFQVGSSATLGTGTQFKGNILAHTSITVTTGSNIECGSALALGGAVTLDSNRITTCGPQPIPEPLTIVGTLIGATAAFHMRKKLKPASKVELNQLC